MIQFLYKKSLAAYLIQGAVQDLVTRCLHGQDLYCQIRIMFCYVVPHHLTLQHCKLAFPAADRDLILHCLMPPLPPGSPHGLCGLSCGSARSL